MTDLPTEGTQQIVTLLSLTPKHKGCVSNALFVRLKINTQLAENQLTNKLNMLQVQCEPGLNQVIETV